MATYDYELLSGSPALVNAYLLLGLKIVNTNAVSNYTEIQWTLELHSLGNNKVTKAAYNAVHINGEEYLGSLAAGSYPVGTYQLLSGSTSIPHNADGTKTISVSAYQHNVNTTFDYLSIDETVELPQIKRQAELTYAPVFNDTQNPTINYTNPVGSAAQGLQACIATEDQKTIVKYRAIPKDATSYTFELTDEERAALRGIITTGNQTLVRFYLKSDVDNVTYHSYMTRLFTITDPEPTLAPIVYDTNTRAIELTGNRNKFIRYYSDAYFDTGAAAVKGATLEYQRIICGSKTLDDYTSNTGTIEDIDSNTFYFSATDSRGFTTNDAVVVDLIPYIKLTSSLTVDSFNARGELTFTVKGKYYNGSFGAQNNTMELELALIDESGNYVFSTSGEDSGWKRLGVITPTVDSEGNYSYTYIQTGLEHESNYELLINVIDATGNSASASMVISDIPVFDWSKTDFVHHTNVYLDNNKTLRTNFTDGTDAQILGVNANNNLTIGWGGYDTGKGNSGLYGNNVLLVAKNKVTINGSTLADFVVEQASNGAWFYRKWNSGRVELYGYQNINSVACNTTLGGWYRTAVQSAPAFPFTVFNPRVITNYESNGYGALVWATTNATTTKPYDYYLIRPTSSAAITGRTLFHVDGTWKQ